MNELILVIVALPLIAAVIASLVQEKSAKSISIIGSAIACFHGRPNGLAHGHFDQRQLPGQ